MIFLTGGTGFVGARLAPRLAQRGEPVRCLVRDPRHARALAELGFELVTGDLRAPERFRESLEGCRAVIHLASALGTDAARMDAVNRRGTEALVQMARQAGVQRFVYTGSHGARPNPRLPYAHSEWRAEQAVAGGARDWLVLRPTVVLGRGDPFSSGLVRMIRRWPAVVLPDGGLLRLQPIWVEDLVRCLLAGLSDGAPRRQIVPVAGGEVLSLRALAEALMDALQVRKPFASLPRGAVKRLVRAGRRFGWSPPWIGGHLLGRDHVLTPDEFERFRSAFGFAPASIGRALAEWSVEKAQGF